MVVFYEYGGDDIDYQNSSRLPQFTFQSQYGIPIFIGNQIVNEKENAQQINNSLSIVEPNKTLQPNDTKTTTLSSLTLLPTSTATKYTVVDILPIDNEGGEKWMCRKATRKCKCWLSRPRSIKEYRMAKGN